MDKLKVRDYFLRIKGRDDYGKGVVFKRSSVEEDGRMVYKHELTTEYGNHIAYANTETELNLEYARYYAQKHNETSKIGE